MSSCPVYRCSNTLNAVSNVSRDVDVVLTIDDEPILSRQHALLIAARLNPGEQVEIEGWREGQRFRATLTVSERREQAL